MSALTSGQAAAGVIVSLVNFAREAADARQRCGRQEEGGGGGARGMRGHMTQGVGHFSADAPAESELSAKPPATTDDDSEARGTLLGAAAYFAASCAVALGCLLAFQALERHRSTAATATNPSASPLRLAPRVPSTDPPRRSPLSQEPSTELAARGAMQAAVAEEEDEGEEDRCAGGVECTDGMGGREGDPRTSAGGKVAAARSEIAGRSLLRLARRLLEWEICILLLFAVTLCIYPTLTSSIHAASGASCAWAALFGPAMYLLFNVGDVSAAFRAHRTYQVVRYGHCMPTAPLLTPLPTSPHPSRASQMLGRMLVCRLPRSAPYVVLLCLARCGFGPILSAFGGPAHARPGDTPLANAAPALTIFLFALSNGWLCTVVFVRAPAAVEPLDRPAAGSLLVLFLNAGLIVGSLLSFAMRQ